MWFRYPGTERDILKGLSFRVENGEKLSISLRQNIGIGYLQHMDDEEALKAAAHKAKVDEFAEGVLNGYDTILGRDSEGSVDVSCGIDIFFGSECQILSNSG